MDFEEMKRALQILEEELKNLRIENERLKEDSKRFERIRDNYGDFIDDWNHSSTKRVPHVFAQAFGNWICGEEITKQYQRLVLKVEVKVSDYEEVKAKLNEAKVFEKAFEMACEYLEANSNFKSKEWEMYLLEKAGNENDL